MALFSVCLRHVYRHKYARTQIIMHTNKQTYAKTSTYLFICLFICLFLYLFITTYGEYVYRGFSTKATKYLVTGMEVSQSVLERTFTMPSRNSPILAQEKFPNFVSNVLIIRNQNKIKTRKGKNNREKISCFYGIFRHVFLNVNNMTLITYMLHMISDLTLWRAENRCLTLNFRRLP